MTTKRSATLQRRVLVIDDTESIHSDFEKVLKQQSTSESHKAIEDLDRQVFDTPTSPRPEPTDLPFTFRIDHAYQGKEGLKIVSEATEEGAPISVAFVDMRMPPGWDGLQTVEALMKADPCIQLVICSAYSDYSWRQIIDRLGYTDRLLILKKPFDQAEVYQLAVALSEKWEAERRTKDLLAKLEQKVEQRTGELSEANTRLNTLNSDLKVAVEEARSAERAKGRFLATMSHEIRTTLNGIIGASHMLNHSQSLPESDREFAGIIQKSGDALMIIINDILDYSKYESGQLELEEIPFSLRDLAKECTNLMENSLSTHKISLELVEDPKLPQLVIGDPARTRQVILNLLNNAIKFGREGVVTLALAAESQTEETLNLRIDVKDRGIGMSQETVQRLFTAFMQADSSTTREFGGTGLGLAICKLLADAMQAEIKVDSELGKGTTFSFRVALPIASPETKPAPLPAADLPNQKDETARVRKAVSHDFRSKRVLLVDDNAINRKLGRRFLSQMQIEVELASNGVEAFEIATANPFDIVLMDLQMPELDGVSATRKIRESGSEVPIVALTANAFAEVREECMAAGMNDFLTKPLRVNELAETLERWFAQPSGDS